MSSNRTYLITGANRGKTYSTSISSDLAAAYDIPGLGKGLLATYLSRPKNTVIAGVRDPNHATAKVLSDLPRGHSSTLIVIKIGSASTTDAAAAVKLLESTHNIKSLDAVIANAGILCSFAKVADVPVAAVQEHISVNGIGPFVLFQATLLLLERSTRPLFVGIGPQFGSIGGMDLRPYPLFAFVQTEMGNAGAAALGLDKAPATLEESISGFVKQIDGATKEETSGHFAGFDGEGFAW